LIGKFPFGQFSDYLKVPTVTFTICLRRWQLEQRETFLKNWDILALKTVDCNGSISKINLDIAAKIASQHLASLFMKNLIYYSIGGYY